MSTDGESESRLTAPERALIASARELADAEGLVYLRHYLRERGHHVSGWTHPEFVYKTCFSSAQNLLGQLADLTERLGGASEPPGR